MELIESFLRYVSVDTRADPKTEKTPSTAGQHTLAQMAANDLTQKRAEGLTVDEHAYVYRYLSPSDGCERLPSIGFIAHLDTSPDVTGENVRPRIIHGYDGSDIVLNEEKNVVTRVRDFPFLTKYEGSDLIVTDGMTLLGADDKAGIAEIVRAVELLRDIPHGGIAVCFTPDEEIGHGASLLDTDVFACDFAYTLDGGELGQLSFETFNAAEANVFIHGLNVHPGSAKGVMKNACMIAMEFDSMLPAAERPQYTSGREGFFHLSEMSGNESLAELSYIVRDHDREKFTIRKDILMSAAGFLNDKYGAGTVEVKTRDQYYNMLEVLKDKTHVIERAVDAMRRCGIEPNVIPTRGGTDGSALSFRGLPCPNIGVGGFNYHGVNEGVCVQSMEKTVSVIVEIAKAPL